MAPKKRKTIAEGAKQQKKYNVLSKMEISAIESKYLFSLNVIATTVKSLAEAVKFVEEHNKEVGEIKAWERYLLCDGLPSPEKPSEIRTFFSKLFYYEKVDIEKTTNWMLDIDERSVLQQVLSRKDLTRKYLRDTTRPNFGHQYAENISNCLQTISDIDGFLDKPENFSKIPLRILSDIHKLRKKAQDNIKVFLDQLAARVIVSEQGYMTPIDVVSAEYAYVSKDFDLHIWTLQNVPIRFKQNNILSWKVKLHQIKVKMLLPFSVLDDNLTICGHHCRFDHFSNKIECFHPPNNIQSRAEDGQNLYSNLQTEWRWMNEMQLEIRNMMKNEYAVYLEKLKEKLAAEAKASKKGGKKINLKEPPQIGPDDLPDVREDIIKEDVHRYKDFIQIELHPDNFQLKEDEVNLRRFQILGGVYHFDFVKKPDCVNFPSITITWVENDGKLIKNRHIVKQDPNNGPDETEKFFVITFELSQTMCHWGEPIACFFDSGAWAGDDNDNDDYLTSSYRLESYTPLVINNFNINGILTKPQIYDIVNACLPRLLSSFRFPSEIHEIPGGDDGAPIAAVGSRKRAQTADDNSRYFFSFEDQNSPERLFPLFDRFKQIIIADDLNETNEENVIASTSSSSPYQKLSDLVEAIEVIKSNYLKYPFESIKFSKEIHDYKARLTFSRMSRPIRESIKKRKSSKTSKSISSSSVHHERGPSAAPEKQQHEQHHKHHGKHHHEEEEEEEEEEEDDQEKIRKPKWTVETIYKSEFDAANHSMTIWTDRLGTFGFAFYRYRHFPFRKWTLRPSRDDPKNETMLTLKSEYALFEIFITNKGYTATVRTLSKDVQLKSISINEPLTDIRDFKKFFIERNLNIFPECDAACYVEGIFSEKHFPTESHVYACMSSHCKVVQFANSIWNRIAPRRIITLELGEIRDKPENFSTLRITPTDAQFVTIKELCSNDLDVVNLEYTPTWRNIEFYADLNQLITSSYSGSGDAKVKDQLLLYYVTTVLCAIKPLSFC